MNYEDAYHSARVVRTSCCTFKYIPYLVVNVTKSGQFSEELLDHEVIETLVDPKVNRTKHGMLVEVCDPVEDYLYVVNGVQLTDFTFPSYWNKRSYGPYDYLHKLRRGASATARPAMPDVVAPAISPLTQTGVFR